MNKITVIFLLILVLGFSIVLLSTEICLTKPDAGDARIFSLMRDIQSMNLISNLYITSEQKTKLIPIIKEAVNCEAGLKAKTDENSEKVISILEKMKKEILQSGKPEEDTIRNFSSFEREIHEKMANSMIRKQELIKETESILTENQKILIGSYEPCIIPNQNTANPERIGQAGNNDIIVKIIEDGRKVPEEEYPEFKTRFKEDMKKRLSVHMPADKIDEEVSRAMNIIDEARKLSDEDFALKSRDLASRFKKPNRGDDKSRMIETIDRFIFSQGSLSYLEK